MESPRGRPDDLSLMTGPPRSVTNTQNIGRCSVEYQNTGERFKLSQRNFSSQYAQTYFFRLQRMEPQLRQKVAKLWPGVVGKSTIVEDNSILMQVKPRSLSCPGVRSIISVPEEDEVALIGTLYKEMKLKPNILSEYSKDRGLEQLIGRCKFADPSDTLVMEDTSARIQLRGQALPITDLVTGVVLAVRGKAKVGGEFWVTDILTLGPQPQSPIALSSSEARYVAFMSGLHIGEEAGSPLRLSLLLDFLTGMLGAPPEQALSSKIVRTVICGGLLSSSEALSSAATHASGRQQVAALTHVREMDMAVTELAGSMPVDVMPGAFDPINRSYPQQPLHHSLFPGAADFDTVTMVTNPHEFQIRDRIFLGTSGQNVDDVFKYCEQEDRLQILQNMLEWSHIVPTSPDTLSSYPFAMDDPFLLEKTPHVLFAGNQPSFESRMYKGPDGQLVRLLCIPKFAETGLLILLNIDTLDLHPLHFQV